MTRPPVILFTLWTGNPGGAENHTWRLCSRLRKLQDLDVRVVFMQHEGMLGERLRSDGVPVRALDVSAGLCGPLMYRRVGRLLGEWTPSVIVTSGYGWDHLMLRLARSRRPVVVVEHGGTLLNPRVFSLRQRLAYRAFRRAVAPHVAAEVCVSDFMRRRQESLPHAQRLLVIRNGVDTDVFVPASRPVGAEDGIHVGAAGRLDRDKGFDVLIRAFGVVVAEAGHLCTLAIAGDGSARQELAELVHRLDLDEVVSFVGRTSEMPAFWREQHLACVPSPLLESFGMVAAEAQATGLPVVASAAGGLAEVVREGETGRLVEPSDVAQLAAAIMEYVADPGKIALHGRQARSWALESLSLERTAAEYAGMIRELASKSSPVA